MSDHNNIFDPLTDGDDFPENIERISRILERHSTLNMAPNQHGIYSASSSQGENDESGMQHGWIRDNVMVAYSNHVIGLTAETTACVRGLLRYAKTQAGRMEAIIRHPRCKHDIQNRPHIRFNATTLSATDQLWGHHQLDAWGYLLWITTVLSCEADMDLSRQEEEFLALTVKYLKATRYYADPDNGTWEEDIKVNSSSTAACIAGLKGIKRYVEVRGTGPVLTKVLPSLGDLIAAGWQSLDKKLPFESPPHRTADAALLFAIEPTSVIADRYMQDLIISLVRARLMGPFGIRRYQGDSYYCQDYDKWFTPEQRSNDHTLSNYLRDQFLAPGMEAQWCLFDPILSVIFGRRYLKSGSPEDLQIQLRFANRALNQLTPAYQCPEMYYCSEGKWIPNPHTPLLWTQANLAIAMHLLRESAKRRRDGV
jgi:hypothetical protein